MPSSWLLRIDPDNIFILTVLHESFNKWMCTFFLFIAGCNKYINSTNVIVFLHKKRRIELLKAYWRGELLRLL